MHDMGCRCGAAQGQPCFVRPAGNHRAQPVPQDGLPLGASCGCREACEALATAALRTFACVLIAFGNVQTVVLLQFAGPPVLFQADGHLQVAAEIHQAASVSRGAAAVARGAERLPSSACLCIREHGALVHQSVAFAAKLSSIMLIDQLTVFAVFLHRWLRYTEFRQNGVFLPASLPLG